MLLSQKEKENSLFMYFVIEESNFEPSEVSCLFLFISCILLNTQLT